LDLVGLLRSLSNQQKARFYRAFREIGKPFLKFCNSEKVVSGAKTVSQNRTPMKFGTIFHRSLAFTNLLFVLPVLPVLSLCDTVT